MLATFLIVGIVSGGRGFDLSAVLQARGGHNRSGRTDTRHNPMMFAVVGEEVSHPPAGKAADKPRYAVRARNIPRPGLPNDLLATLFDARRGATKGGYVLERKSWPPGTLGRSGGRR